VSFEGKPSLVIVPTGHRCERLGVPLNPMSWRPAIEHLADLLGHFSVMACGRLEVLTGMAEGFDMMVGAAALKARDTRGHRLRVVAVIPFEGDIYAFKHATSKKWHASIRSRADHVHVASEHMWDFRTRNYWLADRPKTLGVPGVCWAAWDQDPKKGGGTYQTVMRARLNNLPVDTSFYQVVREQLGVS
jgi:hypothetical protein